MLKICCIEGVVEAGCDEAGRGPLAGSVFAAAVVLDAALVNNPKHTPWLDMLNDSKQLTDKERNYLRPLIEQYATTWAVVEVTAEEIDKINILNAFFYGERFSCVTSRVCYDSVSKVVDNAVFVRDVQGVGHINYKVGNIRCACKCAFADSHNCTGDINFAFNCAVHKCISTDGAEGCRKLNRLKASVVCKRVVTDSVYVIE